MKTSVAGTLSVGMQYPATVAASEGERRFRFFLWNDMHVRAPGSGTRGYPLSNEKALWAAECTRGKHSLEPPDFVVSAGDIVHGEGADLDGDYPFLKTEFLDKLPVPFLPCAGNHENGQGEGIPEKNLAYDKCFGTGWHNYLFTYGGFGFIVVDTSGADRAPDDVTNQRNRFVERAFARLAGKPIFVVTHVPLIAMREEEPLRKSFGFTSWRVADLKLLELVEAHRDTVVAVLCGHIHLTGVCSRNGIWHIMPSGTGGYPSDFAAFDVFGDRIELHMQKAPGELLDRKGDIHDSRRHGKDYTDTSHPTHDSYVWGNPDERALTIALEGKKCPLNTQPLELCVYHEKAGDDWQRVK
jgi:hypothetical protein